eukprot:403351159
MFNQQHLLSMSTATGFNHSSINSSNLQNNNLSVSQNARQLPKLSDLKRMDTEFKKSFYQRDTLVNKDKNLLNKQSYIRENKQKVDVMMKEAHTFNLQNYLENGTDQQTQFQNRLQNIKQKMILPRDIINECRSRSTKITMNNNQFKERYKAQNQTQNLLEPINKQELNLSTTHYNSNIHNQTFVKFPQTTTQSSHFTDTNDSNITTQNISTDARKSTNLLYRSLDLVKLRQKRDQKNRSRIQQILCQTPIYDDINNNSSDQALYQTSQFITRSSLKHINNLEQVHQNQQDKQYIQRQDKVINKNTEQIDGKQIEQQSLIMQRTYDNFFQVQDQKAKIYQDIQVRQQKQQIKRNINNERNNQEINYRSANISQQKNYQLGIANSQQKRLLNYQSQDIYQDDKEPYDLQNQSQQYDFDQSVQDYLKSYEKISLKKDNNQRYRINKRKITDDEFYSQLDQQNLNEEDSLFQNNTFKSYEHSIEKDILTQNQSQDESSVLYQKCQKPDIEIHISPQNINISNFSKTQLHTLKNSRQQIPKPSNYQSKQFQQITNSSQMQSQSQSPSQNKTQQFNLLRKTLSQWDPRLRNSQNKLVKIQINRESQNEFVQHRDHSFTTQKQQIKTPLDFKKSIRMNDDEKREQFLTYFKTNFDKISQIDLRELEHKMKQPRSQIISNLVFYISLCKLIIAQNHHQQSEMLQSVSKGLQFQYFRSAFPQLQYENPEIFSQILQSAVQGSHQNGLLQQQEFIKCAKVLKHQETYKKQKCQIFDKDISQGGGSQTKNQKQNGWKGFEERVQVLLEVIDRDQKGFLRWEDIKLLCKQSLKIYYQGSGIKQSYQHPHDPTDYKLVNKVKQQVIDDNSDPIRMELFDEEMSNYFADFVFLKFGNSKNGQVTQSMNEIRKGVIRMEKIKEVILKSREDSELFQLISGYSAII